MKGTSMEKAYRQTERYWRIIVYSEYAILFTGCFERIRPILLNFTQYLQVIFRIYRILFIF